MGASVVSSLEQKTAKTTPGVPQPADELLSQRIMSLRLPPQANAARTRRAWLPWVLCAILAGTTTLLGYQRLASRYYNSQQSGSAKAASEVQSPEASAAPQSDLALQARGYIVPRRESLISPKVSGEIIELNFIEGQTVPEGFVLARIDPRDYLADLRRAEANLLAAQAALAEATNPFPEEERRQAENELAEARRLLDQYQRDFARVEALYAKRIVSEEDYESAKSRYETQQLRVKRLAAALDIMNRGFRKERQEAAAAQVKLAEAELEKAKLRLEYCTIKAPIAGTILKKNAELGNIVNPVALQGSFSLCLMADLGDLEVDLSIQERDISLVFVGQKCRIQPEAYMKRIYQGEVSRIMPIADRSKGALPVRVKIDIPPEEVGVYLRPDMSAIVSFLRK